LSDFTTLLAHSCNNLTTASRTCSPLSWNDYFQRETSKKATLLFDSTSLDLRIDVDGPQPEFLVLVDHPSGRFPVQPVEQTKILQSQVFVVVDVKRANQSVSFGVSWLEMAREQARKPTDLESLATLEKLTD
jgi:hypothetical protein